VRRHDADEFAHRQRRDDPGAAAMNVLIALIFLSVILAALAVAFFVYSVRNEDMDHSLQLSLKPLEDDP
jgi:cbb3-type cytochrome oxidase maturation protein